MLFNKIKSIKHTAQSYTEFLVELGDVRDTNADQIFIDYEQFLSGSNL